MGRSELPFFTVTDGSVQTEFSGVTTLIRIKMTSNEMSYIYFEEKATH